jgi:cell division protein ZipA
MGLNLETLIGILVILILLILVDGMRRMIRERHGRLRMRIDPRYRDQPEEEEDRGHNPELIGSARVIRRAMEEDQKERPPMVMEPDEAAADTRTAEQKSLFEA